MAAPTTRAELLDLIWDLRDSAYDGPEIWKNVDALTLLQGLGEAFAATEEQVNRSDVATWAEVGEAIVEATRPAARFAQSAD